MFCPQNNIMDIIDTLYPAQRKEKALIDAKLLLWITGIFVFFSTYFYVPPAYSDLGRYYELLESLASYKNILYGVMLQQEEDIDFIYELTMLAAYSVGIGFQFVTALVCTLYWFIISRIFLKSQAKITSIVLVCFLGVIFFPNMMDVIGTARNVMAFLFLFTGFGCWLENKKKWAILCFVLSIFTHFSCTIHVAIFYVAVYLYKILLSKHPMLTNILCALLPIIMYLSGASIVNEIFLSNFMQDMFGDSAGYGSYVSRTVTKVEYNFIGIGQVAFLSSHLLILYLLINVDKRNSLQRVLVMVFFSMITMSYACSYNLLVRFFLCIAYFYASYASDCLNSIRKNKNLKTSLICSSFLLVLIFAWNFHGLIMKYWSF